MKRSLFRHIFLGLVLYIATIIGDPKEIEITKFAVVITLIFSSPFLFYSLVYLYFRKSVNKSVHYKALLIIPYLHSITWLILGVLLPKAGASEGGMLIFLLWTLYAFVFFFIALDAHWKAD